MVSGAGVEDDERAAHRETSTNRTGVPGVSERGLVPGVVPQQEVGVPDELPAAGRGGRVDAGERAGQPTEPAGTRVRGLSSRGTARSSGSPVQ